VNGAIAVGMLPIDLPKRRVTIIFIALMLGTFLAALDGTIVSTPEDRSSLEEVELAPERIIGSEDRAAVYANLAIRARIELAPQACWLLFRRLAAVVMADDDRLLRAATPSLPLD